MSENNSKMRKSKKSKTICTFFQRNACSKGDECRFSHIVPTINESTSTFAGGVKPRRPNKHIKMNIFIDITFKEEVSDHDGYCSGGECDLSSRIYNKIVEVDVNEITNDLQYYIKYADKVIINDDGSYYCDLGDDAKSAGLGPHDYRITVLKVKLVDTNNK
jgi:hypothetical protein